MLKWLVVFCVVFSAALNGEINVLAFSGSTRESSYNQKLVVEAAEIAKQQRANVTVVNLKDYSIPFYDEDLEEAQGMPAKAKELRQLMLQSQVVIIASPEYNGSLSGVLKNTIDWLSRNEQGVGSRDAFLGKKFVIISASPGSTGGARGLVHLKTIIENIGGNVISPTVVVPNASNAFDRQGHLKDPKLRTQLQEAIQAALNK